MNEEKQKLLEERERLIAELRKIAVFDEQSDNWQAIPYKLESEDASDENDVADRFEDYDERIALVEELEAQLTTVKEKLANL